MKKQSSSIRIQHKRGHGEHSSAIFPTSSFVFQTAEEMEKTFSGERNGLIYSRYSNPNTNELIEKMCHLEQMEAGFATASGMAAVWSTLAALCSTGDHIIASRAVFGSTHQLLHQIFPRWNVTCTMVDPKDISSWEKAVRTNTKILFVESPSNPGMELVDLAAAGAFAKSNNLIYCVDNCFATPLLQLPHKYGADLSIHSATKYIDGQGRVLGGLVLGKSELIEQITFFCRHTGPAMSPFNAWILSKSLETLAIRMQRHCENALALAQYLEDQDQVEQVLYPFLPSHPQYDLAKKQMKSGGGIVSFIIKGGKKAAQNMINQLQMISITSNLGDSRTIITHPASTTHSKLSEEERQLVGIQPGLLRISVGLEDIEDIVSDVDSAISSII